MIWQSTRIVTGSCLLSLFSLEAAPGGPESSAKFGKCKKARKTEPAKQRLSAAAPSINSISDPLFAP